MTGGVTRVGGLPGLLGRVTLSAGGTICHVNLRSRITCLAGVVLILPQDQMS